MEVTSENFKDILSQFKEEIDKCSFVSIDLEFSGLNTTLDVNSYDTPEIYYKKVLKSSRDFLVFQYGITVFRYDPNFSVFRHQSFNFYIFRKPVNRNIPDQRFLCQASSVNFLAIHDFNFNKVFKLGIPYLNISEETTYRQTIDEKQKLRQSSKDNKILLIPNENIEFITNIKKTLDEFLQSDEKQIYLPQCSSFVRRLIYQTVETTYMDKIILKTEEKNNIRLLLATKLDTEIKEQYIADELNIIDEYIGFSKIIQIIVNSDKLIVGHNMCLDFFHTIDKFLTPLPSDYNEFKQLVDSLFSKIIDTKYMSSNEPFDDLIKSTVLSDLISTLLKEPFKMVPIDIETDKISYQISDDRKHEAAFDSFITGISFITMWYYLGQLNHLNSNQIFENFDLLSPYLNRIYLMKLRDNQYINLKGLDSNPSRDHVFYITFPKEWKINNILQLFSPFGNIYVSWLDDTSAYVALNQRDQAPIVLKTLSNNETITIMTFKNRQLQLLKNNSSNNKNNNSDSDSNSNCNCNNSSNSNNNSTEVKKSYPTKKKTKRTKTNNKNDKKPKKIKTEDNKDANEKKQKVFIENDWN